MATIPAYSRVLSSNVFEIYDSVPEANVAKMREVISGALNLCAGLYTFVGIFGVIAFAKKEPFGGKNLNKLISERFYHNSE